KVPVLGPEDLVVTKALAHGEETSHYWWDALAIIAKCELDWDYLVHRARRGPRRMLSLLLYAQSTDLAVPDPVILPLSATALGEPRTATCRSTSTRRCSRTSASASRTCRCAPTSTASTSPARSRPQPGATRSPPSSPSWHPAGTCATRSRSSTWPPIPTSRT